MELAWHVTTQNLKNFQDSFIDQLSLFYEQESVQSKGLQSFLPVPERIYVGDEFCSARLPDREELGLFLTFAEDNCLSATFLTPVLTDPGIEKVTPLFEQLKQWRPDSEVVVNDLGVLFFLKKNFPDFQLIMGRVFNRGFKDPRLNCDDITSHDPKSAFFNDCTFSHENVQALAGKLGVSRLEQDLLPYADPGFVNPVNLKTSLYFPFGYVTTGRACFTAGLDSNPDARFNYAGNCSSPCAGVNLVLNHKDSNFKLYQKGNTIFYLYPYLKTLALLERAENQGFRMIFQGGR